MSTVYNTDQFTFNLPTHKEIEKLTCHLPNSKNKKNKKNFEQLTED